MMQAKMKKCFLALARRRFTGGNYMYTCGFCGSTVHVTESGAAHCSFCKMDLFPEDIQKYGHRKSVLAAAEPLLSDAENPTPVLMEFNTFHLIKLLRLVRAERKERYNLMRIILKRIEEQPDLHAAKDAAQDRYEYWSRKVWVIENILRERSSVFPVKISDDYLDTMIKQIEKDNSYKMTFRFSKVPVQ